MASFDTKYQDLLKQIMDDGHREVNGRTGHETVALPGMSVSVDLEIDGFPLLALRKIPLKIFIAEQVWFISGARKPELFLREYTKIWDDFTNPGDVVTVAYGYRWRKHFGRDQLGKLVSLLEKDPSSRHGVIVTWDPSSDGLGGVSKGNVPCPYTFTVNIIGGRLNLLNVVRSNDMILGFPHDVAGFALLQQILSQRLGVRAGIYTHIISNAHIYDTHYDAATTMIGRQPSNQKISLELPEKSFARAEQMDHGLVRQIFEALSTQYKPAEPIKDLKIVL
jgi:thymidylate synthase